MYNNLRRFIALLFAIAVFYLGIKSQRIYYWAIVIIAVGEIIRIWAAGYIKKNKILSIVGPYKYVRNPLYVGSLLIGVGFGLFIANYYLLIFMVVTFLIIYNLKIKSEEEKLKSIFGEQYLTYKKIVNRWLPRLSSYGHDSEEFNVKLAIIKNKEYNAILGCLAMIFAIIIFKK
ncbi:MAG: hypothetical protein A2539_01060 [Elusimicrobia bacterium RIFOXYD2_FULL_34_15]|nr:MAG: hypothetical protein A2539_01060 [Elusimicrobia bacterium RIFOXYD2_FULL_34_15]